MQEIRRAIAVLVLLALAACAGLPRGMEPLSVTLADVRPSQMGLLEQEFLMKIRVQNPNSVDVPLQGVAFAVELNGKDFAKGVSRQDGVVPAFGDVVLDVKAISTLGSLLEQMGAMRDGPPARIDYRLQGRLTPVSGAALPFDSAGSVDFSALSGGGAK